MSLVNGAIVDKHMTYKVSWDLEVMKKEQEKGADGVSFKYWELIGLAVLKSFYGNYLVGLMFTLDYAKITHPKIRCETGTRRTRVRRHRFPHGQCRETYHGGWL